MAKHTYTWEQSTWKHTCGDGEDKDTRGTTRARHGASASTLNKASLFPSPVSLTRPIPLLFWGRQLVPSGVPCLSPLDVSWSGSLAKENNTHTLTQIPPHTHTHTHTQTEKPSGIYNWQTHSRNAVEQLQSWTIAANTTSTGFSLVRQNIVDFMKDLWDYLHTFLIHLARFLDYDNFVFLICILSLFFESILCHLPSKY